MDSKKFAVMYILMAIGLWALIDWDDENRPNVELQKLQLEKTKLSIEILKLNLSKDFLTVSDLDSIYTCVDTKISNKDREVKFPCVRVRGDSF